jgi:hypothetical protein
VIDSQVYGGLCARCKGSAGCTILRDPDKPILRCKGFDSFQYSVPMGLREKAKEAALGRQRGPSRIEGLCGDCGNRESCVFRQREGGTWHCEEYR